MPACHVWHGLCSMPWAHTCTGAATAIMTPGSFFTSSTVPSAQDAAPLGCSCRILQPYFALVAYTSHMNFMCCSASHVFLVFPSEHWLRFCNLLNIVHSGLPMVKQSFTVVTYLTAAALCQGMLEFHPVAKSNASSALNALSLAAVVTRAGP